MRQENEQTWKLAGCEEKCTSSDLFKRLKNGWAKIVVLDGYSGCGKTMLLRRLQKEAGREVILFSDEKIVDIMVQEASQKRTDPFQLLNVSQQAAIIGIEDVDLLAGKSATQAILCERIRIAAGKHLVIVTGNDMTKRVPKLLKLLGAEQWQAVRPDQEK